MENGTSSGCRRVKFDTLCTEVCKKKMKWSEAVPCLLCKTIVSEKVLCVFRCFLHIVTRKYYFEVSHKQIFLHIVLSPATKKNRCMLMPTIQAKSFHLQSTQLNSIVWMAGALRLYFPILNQTCTWNLRRSLATEQKLHLRVLCDPCRVQLQYVFICTNQMRLVKWGKT